MYKASNSPIHGVKELVANNRKLIQKVEDSIQKNCTVMKNTELLNQRCEKVREQYLKAVHTLSQEVRDLWADPQLMQLTYGSPQRSTANECAWVLRQAKSVVFLTGPGLSSEALSVEEAVVDGVVYSYEALLTEEFMRKNPAVFWHKILDYVSRLQQTSPGPVHLAIQELSEHFMEVDKSVKVITLTADGLHTADSVYEIHGNARQAYCLQSCGMFPLVNTQHQPQCPHCNGPARPNICLFGETYTEAIHLVDSAKTAAAEADCLVVAGAKLFLMFPRALVADHAKSGKPIIDVAEVPVAEYGNVYATYKAASLSEIIQLSIEFDQLYSEGYANLKAKRYESAVNQFTTVINAQPKDVQSLYGRACALFYLERYSECLRDTERITEIDPDHSKAAMKGIEARLHLFAVTQEKEQLLEAKNCCEQVALLSNSPKTKDLRLRVDKLLAFATTHELEAEAEELVLYYSERVGSSTALQKLTTWLHPKPSHEWVPLMCPINYDYFKDPVTTQAGVTYEREVIAAYLQHSTVDPVTRIVLTSTDLVPNKVVQKAIAFHSMVEPKQCWIDDKQ